MRSFSPDPFSLFCVGGAGHKTRGEPEQATDVYVAPKKLAIIFYRLSRIHYYALVAK